MEINLDYRTKPIQVYTNIRTKSPIPLNFTSSMRCVELMIPTRHIDYNHTLHLAHNVPTIVELLQWISNPVRNCEHTHRDIQYHKLIGKVQASFQARIYWFTDTIINYSYIA